MKNKYLVPIIEIISINTTDIINTSSVDDWETPIDEF